LRLVEAGPFPCIGPSLILISACIGREPDLVSTGCVAAPAKEVSRVIDFKAFRLNPGGGHKAGPLIGTLDDPELLKSSP
jgi:hypothetical protein